MCLRLFKKIWLFSSHKVRPHISRQIRSPDVSEAVADMRLTTEKMKTMNDDDGGKAAFMPIAYAMNASLGIE